MSASPEFFRPSAAPAYSPSRLLLAVTEPAADDCRTPAGAEITYLGAPATCPPAPRKQRPPAASACRKRLFDVEVISLRFDDVEAIFRPSTLQDARLAAAGQD